MLRLLLIAFLLIAPHFAVASTTCNYWDTHIKFSDGTKQCLREFSEFLSRKPGNSGSSLAESISAAGHAALAVNEDSMVCSLAIGLVTAQAQGTQSDQSIVGQPAGVALERCTMALRAAGAPSSCKCHVLFDFDSTSLTQTQFRERLTLLEQQAQRGGRALGDTPAVIGTNSQPSEESNEYREREKLKTQFEAERQARIALERRLAEQAKLIAQGPAETPAPITPTPSRQVKDTSNLKERRVALVIGNSAYKVNPLANPTNDAADVASALLALGFETTLLQNATISDMRQATRKFADLVSLSDVALVFYAGHGIEVKGRNFLLPINADVKHEYELEDQAYEAGRWLDMLESIKGANSQRVNIVILDACRDNAFSRGWRSAGRGLARMDAPTGTFVAFATAPGKVASDGDGQRNSPFTRGLLSVIQRPNLPIELMFKEVRRMVIEETRGEQVPWDNSSLVGNFSFKVGN